MCLHSGTKKSVLTSVDSFPFVILESEFYNLKLIHLDAGVEGTVAETANQ